MGALCCKPEVSGSSYLAMLLHSIPKSASSLIIYSLSHLWLLSFICLFIIPYPILASLSTSVVASIANLLLVSFSSSRPYHFLPICRSTPFPPSPHFLQQVIDFDGPVDLYHFYLLRAVGKGAFGKVRVVQHKQTKVSSIFCLSILTLTTKKNMWREVAGKFGRIDTLY